MIGSFLALFSWMIYETLHSSYKKNMQEEAFGSAKWNDPNFTKDMREKDMYQNWIFTKTEIFSKNMKVTKRNRNCTLIGRPGTGKSRYWLIPNILNSMAETIIVTDPKEEILKATGMSLKKKGYDFTLNGEPVKVYDNFIQVGYRIIPRNTYNYKPTATIETTIISLMIKFS